MDAQTLRRILWDFIRFNPKDFTIQGTPTGYNVSARKTAQVEPECYLGLYDRSDGGAPKVGVKWGMINGRQPNGFNSRGKIDAIPVNGTPRYIYAFATLDPATLLWADSGVIIDASPTKANTTTIGYELLGVVTVENERIKSLAFTCGHVEISICDLAFG